MKPAHPLISEIFAKFIHTFYSTYDKPLEIKFIGNTHVQGHIKRIVMCLERPSRSTTIEWLQNRCFNFQISLLIEVVPHRIVHLGPVFKYLAYVRVDDEVNITLTIALFRICKCIMHHTLSIHFYNR